MMPLPLLIVLSLLASIGLLTIGYFIALALHTRFPNQLELENIRLYGENELVRRELAWYKDSYTSIHKSQVNHYKERNELLQAQVDKLSAELEKEKIQMRDALEAIISRM